MVICVGRQLEDALFQLYSKTEKKYGNRVKKKIEQWVREGKDSEARQSIQNQII